jgi:membrane associated rhomboid family serine protease
MNKITEAVKHLIIINVILFVAVFYFKLGFGDELALYFPKNEQYGIWQYITHMFMHGSPMHLLFNMYGLWAFGTPLEQMWGRNKFLFFYFSAGLGAGAIYTLVNYYQFIGVYDQLVNMGVSASDIQNILNTGSYNEAAISISNEKMTDFYMTYHTPAVGASGAVYGVLVAFAMAYPNSKLALIFFPVPIAAKYFIPVIIFGDLFFGVTKYSVGNIAHFAHIGGALIGFLIAWSWRNNQFKRWD